MNIVLDTNVICGDWYLGGLNFGLLKKYLKQSDARLFVPEIIVSETRNLFKRKLAPLVKNMTELRRFLPEEEALQTLPDFDEKCREYNTKLDERLAELNAERLEHSDVPHDTIVARSLAPRKPFRKDDKGGDKGYRDTLLWEVILRKIATKDTTTFLISANYKDFANKHTDKTLHADLIEDLVSANLPKDSVQFYSNLKSFIDEQVRSQLKVTVDDIVQSLKDGSYKDFSFGTWFVENRDAIIEKVNEKISSAFPHVYSELEEPTVTYIEDPKEIYVAEVTRYEGDEEIYHIEVCVTLDMALDVFVDKAAYYSHLCEEVPLGVWDSDWNKWYVWAVIEELELPVSFWLVFNTSQKIVEYFEVSEVGEIWGWCRFCRAQIKSEAAEECWSCGKSFG